MKFTFMRAILATLLLSIVTTTCVGAEDSPKAIPTFECIGLYWKPVGGDTNRECHVRYRAQGEVAWRDGFPLWFDPRDREYRGSLVHLKPGTAYDIQLLVAGTSAKAQMPVRTWSEQFPVKKTIPLPAVSSKTLVITGSGTADGYLLFAPGVAGRATMIDVKDQSDACIQVKASHVIIRGLTLKNARVHGIELDEGAHDIVIEHCDISGWGRISEDGWGHNSDSAIYSKYERLARVIVQRNHIHHPRGNSNNWTQNRPRPGKREPNHPEGPQAVSFFNSDGNHVIRHNTIWSDEQHQYNDVLGAGSNFSLRGFPNRDSDIYGNQLSDCWDDAIESEGANCNVRIWGNYLTDCYVAVACASSSVGPLYVWRNVSGVSRVAPGGKGGGFLKTSDNLGGGRVYVFHNTTLQPLGTGGTRPTVGVDIGMGWGGPMVNVTSRNNLFHVNRTAIQDRGPTAQGDYDHDLYSTPLKTTAPQEPHGKLGVPGHASGFGFKDGCGVFTLAPKSPGFDAGIRLPNFNDTFTGTAPDIGAHEAGTAPMQFGATPSRR